MTVAFTGEAWEDYLFWQQEDEKLLARINRFIEEIRRNPFKGIGKPEPLKRDMQGWWSRRINEQHRIVYKVEESVLIIAQCRHHYKK